MYVDILDDSMSGIIVVIILVRGRILYVVNIGDLRVVIVYRKGKDLVAVDLSID